MAEKNFEQSIKLLEEIVSKLEGSEISLEESIALFEEGVKLTKSCQKMLDDAKKKVSVLMIDENGKTAEFGGMEE